MNQDYVRIHPYGDRKPRIITPEILKDFKNGLCEVMKDQHFEFNVEYDEFHRVKSVGMCLPGRSSLFVYRASDNCLKYVKSRRQWPKRTYDKIHDLIAEDLSNERNTQLLEVDPKNLKKVTYHPDSFTSTCSVQLVNDQLVIFLDGNKENFDPDNLAVVTRKELMILNHEKMLTADKDLSKTGVLVAKLKMKIKEKENG